MKKQYCPICSKYVKITNDYPIRFHYLRIHELFVLEIPDSFKHRSMIIDT